MFFFNWCDAIITLVEICNLFLADHSSRYKY